MRESPVQTIITTVDDIHAIARELIIQHDLLTRALPHLRDFSDLTDAPDCRTAHALYLEVRDHLGLP